MVTLVIQAAAWAGVAVAGTFVVVLTVGASVWIGERIAHAIYRQRIVDDIERKRIAAEGRIAIAELEARR